MVCVCPPHTSISLSCFPADNLAISSEMRLASSGSRYSSTYFILMSVLLCSPRGQISLWPGERQREIWPRGEQRRTLMSMKYVDEYRDPELARRISEEIARLSAGKQLKLMEVCGGHTHTIYKHGVEDVLPPTIDLVHGPGCPVCVLPMGRIDDAIAIARMDGVIFTTFGDMMRVPGSNGSLLDAKAEGADVRFVYSPLDALKLARQHPDRRVVFFAIGFETTAPSTAVTLLRAKAEGIQK